MPVFIPDADAPCPPCLLASLASVPHRAGLCTAAGVTAGSVTKRVCANTPDTCEVYIKKGAENGVSGINTCRQYCEAYGMTCTAQYDDNDNNCRRARQYDTCDDGGGGTSDHICQCGGPTTTTNLTTPTTTPYNDNTTYSPGTHVVRGRYVRIGSLKVVMQGDSNPVLNLAEVQAFSPSGTLLNPVGATLSSTHSSAYSASRCIDGSLVQTNQQSICHSDASDKDPILVIDYGKMTEITSIRVFNRQESTGGSSSRIDGATMSITTDKDGRDVVWSSMFEGTQSTYTFQPATTGG